MCFYRLYRNITFLAYARIKSNYTTMIPDFHPQYETVVPTARQKHEKWLQPGSNDFNVYPFNSLLENKKPSN